MAKATYKLIYEGKDITRDLAGEIIGLTYRDKTVGEADELTLRIKDDVHKWKGAWNPKQGDKIEASIIDGAQRIDCGKFTVAHLDFSGSIDGHYLTLQALGAGVLDPVRTKTSFAHEGKTLLQIAKTIADKYSFRVQGIIHDYSIKRVTQFHEGDLAFLHRLAEEFGYIFSLRGNILVFSYLPELAAVAGGIEINGSDIFPYNIRDKVAGIYVRGQNRYHNSKQKKLYDSLVKAGANPSKDVMRMIDHVDNDEQGLYKADGRLYKKNLSQVEIDGSMPGNVYVMSGVNMKINNFESYSGTYFVAASTHNLDNENNYVTSAEWKKIVPNHSTGNKKGTEVDE